MRVGAVDGIAVVSSVGTDDGAGVGTEVGADDGAGVGTQVGADDNVGVGDRRSGVGARDGHEGMAILANSPSTARL